MAGAGVSPGTTNVAADDVLPARQRFVRQVYDYAPVPVLYQAKDGQPTAGLYLVTFQRPLTSGAVGRGINVTLVEGCAVRAHEVWIKATVITYEHEIGATLAKGTLPSGATYGTAVLTSTRVTMQGLIRAGDAGGKIIPFSTLVERRESDLVIYADDSFTYGARNGVLVSSVTNDAFPAGARDVNGAAKGAAGFQPSAAMPAVVCQNRLLSINGSFIDRYDLDGKYLDRVPNPRNAPLYVNGTLY